MAYLFNEVRT
jgi:glycine/serine hydroxymethyltransferase